MTHTKKEIMKKITLVLVILFTLFSCNKKENQNIENLKTNQAVLKENSKTIKLLSKEVEELRAEIKKLKGDTELKMIMD